MTKPHDDPDEDIEDLPVDHFNMGDKEEVSNRIRDRIAEIDHENQYSYNLSSSDIFSAHDIATTPLADLENEENKEVRDLISTALARYNARFGTELSFQTIREYIETAITAGPEFNKIQSVVMSDLIAKAAYYILTKSIIVAVYTLDSMLNNLQRKKYQQDIVDETLLAMDRVIHYVDRFESIRDKYKIYDLQASIDVIKSENDRKYDRSANDAEGKINDILMSISSSLSPLKKEANEKDNKKDTNGSK